ncbi:MAG: hypothetical protein RIF32_13645 [Leptospirales bacterium]
MQYHSALYPTCLALLLTAPVATACVPTDCKDATCDIIDSAALFSYFSSVSTFTAVTQTGDLLTSFDGRTWQSQNLAPANLLATNYDSDFFYASGNGDRAYRSPDALTWTELASLNTGTSDNYFSIVSHNGILVAGGGTGAGQVRRSADQGLSWTNLPVTTGSTELAGLESAGGVLRGVNGSGEFMRFNADASAYTVVSPPGVPGGLGALHYRNGVWTVAGSNGFIARTADDGDTWSTLVVNAGHLLIGLTYGNGRFVASGHDGTDPVIWTSTDEGLTWNQSSPLPGRRGRDIAFGNDLFVMTGNGGLLAYSSTPEISNSWVDVTNGAANISGISARNLKLLVGPLSILN